MPATTLLWTKQSTGKQHLLCYIISSQTVPDRNEHVTTDFSNSTRWGRDSMLLSVSEISPHRSFALWKAGLARLPRSLFLRPITSRLGISVTGMKIFFSEHPSPEDPKSRKPAMIDRNYPNPNWNDGTAPHPKRDNTFDKIVPNSTVLVVFLESYPGQPGWNFPYEQTTKFAPGPGCSKADYVNVPVNSKTAHPPLGQSPGIWLRTVGNLTQNEVRPVGQLTFVPKRLSAVGNKRIFSKWRAFTGHCSCRFHVGFSVVVVLYSYIVEYAFV